MLAANDVIDLVRKASVVLMHQAVFTPSTCTFFDQECDLAGRHPSDGGTPISSRFRLIPPNHVPPVGGSMRVSSSLYLRSAIAATDSISKLAGTSGSGAAAAAARS